MPTSTTLPVRTRGGPSKPLAKRKTKPRLVQSKPLTEPMLLFVERYLVDFNATRAYRETHPYCSPATANVEGPKLTSDPRIASLIKRRTAELKARYERSQERTLEELAYIALSNIADLFDEKGSLIAPQDLPREIAAAVRKLEGRTITAHGGKVVGHTVTVQMHDKVKALQLLGLHYGVFGR